MYQVEYTYVCVYVYACVHIYVYICIHTYTCQGDRNSNSTLECQYIEYEICMIQLRYQENSF